MYSSKQHTKISIAFILVFFLTVFVYISRAATFTVTSNASGTAIDGVSLRWAISQANANPGADNINFNISGPAPHTISLSALLPDITGQVTLDGTSQPANGYTGNSPKIVIYGNGLSGYGLFMRNNAASSQIKGLVVRNFVQSGIRSDVNNVSIINNVVSNNGEGGITFLDVSNCQIKGNKLGTDTGGTTLQANAYGIIVGSCNNIQIGDVGEGNLISGNLSAGILVGNSSLVTIKGNYVGTDIFGQSSIPNGNGGIYLNGGCSNITIGGANSGEGNLISGNSFSGIYVLTSNDNQIKGNKIGVDNLGVAPLPNGFGITLVGGRNNTIGGVTALETNLISGNGTGVFIQSSNHNYVLGNKIGTDISGINAIGNTQAIDISASDSNYVGGSVLGAGNLISGNVGGAISINQSSYTQVKGNNIGVNSTLTNPLPNATGISIIFNSNKTIIGGSLPTEKNIISGSTFYGIYANFNSKSTQIKGNYIGTDNTGTILIPNNGSAVDIELECDSTVLGGSNLGEGNVIAGTNGYLVLLRGNNNIVKGNKIGTNASGTSGFGNTSSTGLFLNGSVNNIIGGNGVNEGNLISGLGYGCIIQNSSNNIIKGNKIGTDITGAYAIPNKNYGIGLTLDTADIIGGILPGEGNLISGNWQPPFAPTGGAINLSACSFIQIKGNKIGTNNAGNAAIPNGTNGIYVQGGDNNLIGDTLIGAGNLISGNALNGIQFNAVTANNKIIGNKIGTDITGMTAIPNSVGISVISNSNNNFIGGASYKEGNLISGNTSKGIDINRSSSNQIKGNKIGVKVNGTTPLGNGVGIYINSTAPTVNKSNDNIIGGATIQEANIISGNTSHGIYITNTSRNYIKGNKIGIDSALTTNLANNGDGIFIDRAWKNYIGGSLTGEGNIIAFNAQNGINVFAVPSVHADSNLLSRNLIYNQPKGINLNYLNPVPGNNSKPVPTITSAVSGTGGGSVSGTSQPNDIIEVFKSNSGGVDALAFLGSATASATGNWTVGGLTLLGTETLLATATDVNNNTSEFGVASNCITTVDAGADAAICLGASTVLGGNPTAIGCSSSTLYYSWFPPEGLNSPNIANPVATPDTTTIYTLTVFDNLGIVATDTIKITVHLLPQFSVTAAETIICEGQSTQLNATGSGNFSWSPTTGLDNPNSAMPIATPSVSTNYMVTLTDGNNCSSQQSIFIEVSPQPVVTTSGNVNVCEGGAGAILHAYTNATNVQWSPTTGLLAPSNVTTRATPSTTTVYTVVASIGSCSAQASLTMTVNEQPSASYTYSYPGLNVQFTSYVALPATFNWTFGDSTSGTAQNPSHTYSAAGIYEVCLTVTNGCGTAAYCNNIEVKVPDAACCH